MKLLLFISSLGLSLLANGQIESTPIKVMNLFRHSDSVIRATVIEIDKTTGINTLYDTISFCDDGCSHNHNIYLTFIYNPVTSELLKVKWFDSREQCLKQYYYSDSKMIHVKFKDLTSIHDKRVIRSSGTRNFDLDYMSPTRYGEYNDATVEQMQFLVDGYKYLLWFNQLLRKRS